MSKNFNGIYDRVERYLEKQCGLLFCHDVVVHEERLGRTLVIDTPESIDEVLVNGKVYILTPQENENR